MVASGKRDWQAASRGGGCEVGLVSHEAPTDCRIHAVLAGNGPVDSFGICLDCFQCWLAGRAQFSARVKVGEGYDALKGFFCNMCETEKDYFLLRLLAGQAQIKKRGLVGE